MKQKEKQVKVLKKNELFLVILNLIILNNLIKKFISGSSSKK